MPKAVQIRIFKIYNNASKEMELTSFFNLFKELIEAKLIGKIKVQISVLK